MSSNTADQPRRPYPGLRPFRPDEADLFFGRDEQIDQLLERLGRSRFLRFLAVVGESGCGKSSLIYAGMIPALETGFLGSAGADWLVAAMRPGSQPMRNLATTLLESGAVGRGTDRSGEDLALIEAELRRGPLGLLDALRQGGGAGEGNLLLVVDQFEEIFRFRRDDADRPPADEQAVDRNEAAAFVALILGTVREPGARVYVVLTMRSDFLGDCALFSGLPEALNDSQFLTPRLSFDQRRAAIEGPARVEGGRVEPELTTALLNDMGPGPDQLPLMQHALMRAWTVAVARAAGAQPIVQLRDYDGVGRLKDALSLHADSVFEELPADQKPVAERLFRALTGGNTGKRDTRRPTKLGEVATIAGVEPGVVAQVIDHFRGGDRNFLTPATGLLKPETVIDISHESLIRQWVKLDGWSRDEAKSAETYRLLERTAAEWSDPWTGPNLDRVLEWRRSERPNEAWAARYGGDFGRAMAFIEAGIEQRRKQLEAEKDARRRDEGFRAIKRLAILTSAVALVALIFGSWALVEEGKAKKAEDLARKSETAARRSEELERQASRRAEQSAKDAIDEQAKAVASAQLATQRRSQAERQTARANALILASKAQNLADVYPARSILLAAEAIQTNRRDNGPLNVDAENVLRRTLGKFGGTGLSTPGEDVTCVAYSPDGTMLAAGSAGVGGRVTLWDAKTLRRDAKPLEVREGAILSLAFGRPDGKTLSVAFRDESLADYRPDGTTLRVAFQEASLADDERSRGGVGSSTRWGVVTWDVAARKRIGTQLMDGSVAVELFAFSPDLQILATASPEGSVTLWDATSGKKHGHLQPPDRVTAMRFSPDGRFIAMGTLAGVVDVWNVTSMKRVLSLRGHTGIVVDVAFSPNGQEIATCSVDGMARLWSVESSSLKRSWNLAGQGNSVSFSPAVPALAVATDKSVFLWNMNTGQALSPSPLLGGEGFLSNLTFRRDGKAIAVRDGSGLRVWDLTEGHNGRAEPRVLSRAGGVATPGMPARFGASPDGTWVVEVSANLARVWKLTIADGDRAEPAALNLDGFSFPPARVLAAPNVLFSPNGERLAIIGERQIGIWDCTGTITRNPRHLLSSAKEQSFRDPVFSRDGRWLAVSSGADNLELRLFDLTSAKPGTTITPFTRASTRPAPADAKTQSGPKAVAKGAGIGSGSRRSSPPAYPQRQVLIDSPEANGPRGTAASSTAFSDDGHWMATCRRGQRIELWPLRQSNPAASPRLIDVEGIASGLTFRPNTDTLVAACLTDSGSTIRVLAWQIGDDGKGGAEVVPDLKHRISIDSESPSGKPEKSETFSPKLSMIGAGSLPGGERNVVASGIYRRIAFLDGRPAPPLQDMDVSLLFSQDGAILVVVADSRSELLSWTDQNLGRVHSKDRPPFSPYRARAFSPDSRWLLMDSDRFPATLLSLHPPGPTAYSLSSTGGTGDWYQFSQDSHLLATAANDDSVSVRDLQTLRRERDPAEAAPAARIFPGLSPPVGLVRFGPDARQLVTADASGSVQIWRLDTAALLKVAERVVGRNLSQAEWTQYFPGLEYQQTFSDLPRSPTEPPSL